jgi:heptosyltransferase-2
MRILVVRLSSMGDVILATPALAYLRQQHPESTIWFATGREYAELFSSDPRVDRVVALDPGPGTAGDLAGQKWDWIVDLQNSRRSRAIIARLGHGVRTTAFDKLHGRRALLLIARINAYGPADHVVARYLRAAGWQGGRPPFAPSVRVDPVPGEAGIAWLNTRLDPSRPIAALMPFSAWTNKQWPLEGHAQVAGALIQRGWSTLVLGGPDDAPAASAFARGVGDHCVSAAGELSLAQTAAALTRCAVALGIDTGLSHLARACGVRTVVIYGSTTWQWGFFPYGEPAFRTMEVPLWCRPCHAHGGTVCWRGSRPCLSRISADQAVDALLQLASRNSGMAA